MNQDVELHQLQELLKELVELFHWSDASPLHAALHVGNAVNNLRADLAMERHRVQQLEAEVARLSQGEVRDQRASQLVMKSYAGDSHPSYGVSIEYEVKSILDNAVSRTCEVTILLPDPKESEGLRQALATVQKYQDVATKATKTRVHGKDPNCDWVMFNFAVKNDKVVITVDSGSCG